MDNQLMNNVYYNENDLISCNFKSLGINIKVHKFVILFGFENISIGNNVQIDPFTSIIGSGSIRIGSNIHIGSNCFILGRGGIEIEDFSGISPGAKLLSATDDFSGDHLTNPNIPAKYRGIKIGPIILKRHALVGAGSIVLPDITIEEGAAVGAMSLVTKSLPAWGIYLGNPLRQIKKRSMDLLKLEAEFLNERHYNEETGNV